MHPKAGLDMFGITKYDNYPLESHENIETKDGYLLQIFRIPHGKVNLSTKPKIPVFFMHGLFMTSEGWLYNEPKNCLPYLLADLGYDVWLGNSRGNCWGLKHKKLDPKKDKSKFWNFSWHEIGIYDVPAMIDYILMHTNKEQIIYIGHSQGNTVFFVMACERPEYNEKIKLSIVLSPVVFNYNMFVPFFKLSSTFIVRNFFQFGAYILGVYVLVENGSLLHKLIRSLTTGSRYAWVLFSKLCMHFSGYNNKQLDLNIISAIATKIPTSAAVKQLLHYNQLIANGKFEKYNHLSKRENLKRYGHETPQDYDLSNVTTSIALFYAKNDRMSAEKDVEILKSKLSNVVLDHRIKYPKFTHLDFILAKDVSDLLYNDVIDCIKQHT